MTLTDRFWAWAATRRDRLVTNGATALGLPEPPSPDEPPISRWDHELRQLLDETTGL